MEKQVVNITNRELNDFMRQLDEFMRQIQGMKSTIEILQDEELMSDIIESENQEKKKAKLLDVKV